MTKRSLLGILGMAILAVSLQAVVPQKWELRTKDDFLKGKFDGISVSNDGVLALAPKIEPTAAPTEEFYLSLVVTPDGVTYLGTGHGGKVYRIGKDGKADLYFQTPEMDVTCLALDRKGVLYAGTSPNGKIYKITDKAKGDEFFNPAEKYIWDLLFMESGVLWAAVGETGGIYAIGPQGEGRIIFKSEETHILCLRKSGRGDVIAGSGGNGLVYRISPEGRASVIYETPYEEVRSLAVDRDGAIYAAASGTPAKVRRETPLVIPAAAAQPVRASGVTVTVSSSGAVSAPELESAAGRDSGALYRISNEGIAKVLWSSTEEMVYTVVLKDSDGRVIFGTGGKGRIYSVDKAGNIALLLQQNAEQIFLLAPLDSKIYVLSNNPSLLGQLMTEQRFSGEYVSPILDARTLSSWGRLVWEGSSGMGAAIQLQTRTGNTYDANSTWSDWSPLYQKQEEQIVSPKARFLQVKALFRTQSGTVSPTLGKLTLFYLQTNIAPVVTRLEFLMPGEVYLKIPEQDDVILGVQKNLPDQAAKKDDLRMVITPKKAERKGFQTVDWDASDENGDTLSYTISIKKEGESDWRVLQDDLSDTIYSFDTTAFPDGTYFLKITASDSPSNPLGLDLKSEKVSPPLVIDNSLPVVKNFAAARNGQMLDVSFQAEDNYSYIQEVKVLIRPDEWHVVFPVDGICDSRSEAFKFSLKIPAGAENLITIRVRDSYGNVGVYRQNF